MKRGKKEFLNSQPFVYKIRAQFGRELRHEYDEFRLANELSRIVRSYDRKVMAALAIFVAFIHHLWIE